MKRKSRALAWLSVLVGVAIGAVMLEVLATGWLWIEEGAYVSAEKLYDRAPNSFIHAATKGKACTYVDGFLPHPYLSYVHHGDPPCGHASTNNVGLYGTDFPTRRRTDRYVVLLTGGSVAAQMGQAAPTPPRFLEEALNRAYASPTGKPFLVLNGGEGGWKEPKQFILFSIYAPLVDAVVTLDGFNEFLMFAPNQTMSLETQFSFFRAVNPLFRGEFADAVWGWMVARAAQAIAAYPVHSSLMGLARRWNVMQYERRTRMDTIFGLPGDVVGNPQKIFAAQLERYRSYEISIKALADAHNVKSAFFLQPVPAWGKELTEEEKKADSPSTILAASSRRKRARSAPPRCMRPTRAMPAAATS